MSDKKIVQIIQRLHKKTIDHDIKWEVTDDNNSFQTSISKYAVRITGIPNREDPSDTDYYITIYNEIGREIESIGDEDFQEMYSGGWDLLNELF